MATLPVKREGPFFSLRREMDRLFDDFFRGKYDDTSSTMSVSASIRSRSWLGKKTATLQWCDLLPNWF
jgi:hypothetical protein